MGTVETAVLRAWKENVGVFRKDEWAIAEKCRHGCTPFMIVQVVTWTGFVITSEYVSREVGLKSVRFNVISV
jgi:hypothetical protein